MPCWDRPAKHLLAAAIALPLTAPGGRCSVEAMPAVKQGGGESTKPATLCYPAITKTREKN